MRRKKVEVNQNWIDKAVNYVAPRSGLKRFQARFQSAVATAYVGASRGRRGTKEWRVSGGDSDSDILPELQDLRERSRDLIRNTPIATGAINTKVTNVIGGGLRLHCRIDHQFLGLSEDEADAWEANTQREFNKLWAVSQDCSADRQGNFYELQDLVWRSTLENGDVFALLPLKKRKGNVYSLSVQLIEADRVTNKDNKMDTKEMSGGISRDASGAPTHIHILKVHPGSRRFIKTEWQEVAIFGSKTGRRNVLHIFRRLRIGQIRGIPDLAPVIEVIKQMGTYTDAEVSAAVVSGLFTVFIESEGGIGNPLDDGSPTSSTTEDDEVKMGAGAIIDLAGGEKVQFADPKRPNTAFDPFMLAVLRQVGVALEIPLELLIGHFTASYSASRAALEQAWKFFRARREWIGAKFCNPIYADWMAEAVELGRIVAPGFLTGDPAIRAAYLQCQWIGPAKGHIQPLQEIKAEVEAVNLGSKTLDQVTAETTGADWEDVVRQRRKEKRAMADADGADDAPITDKPEEPDDDPDEIDRPPGEPSDEPEEEPDNEPEGEDDILLLRQAAETYGVAVRAGAVTPQTEDEIHFRSQLSLPGMGAEVLKVGQETDRGTRRPVTIAPSSETRPTDESGKVINDDVDTPGDEPVDDEPVDDEIIEEPTE